VRWTSRRNAGGGNLRRPAIVSLPSGHNRESLMYLGIGGIILLIIILYILFR
jgi:hypothetical protein